MATNPNLILRRPDRGLILAVAAGFPLVVFAGFYKSYFLRAFFDVPPIANSLVHVHGIVMTVWVVLFIVQFALVRTRNVKLHMSMGIASIAFAALLVVVGLATAYDSQIVRGVAPPGIEPFKFFLIPVFDMILFVLLFGGAIYYRRRPTEHRALMLLTAVNFSASPLSRISIVPGEYMLVWAFGMPILIALLLLAWHTFKHGKLNLVFAIATCVFVLSVPLRIAIGETAIWQTIAARIAP